MVPSTATSTTDPAATAGKPAGKALLVPARALLSKPTAVSSKVPSTEAKATVPTTTVSTEKATDCPAAKPSVVVVSKATWNFVRGPFFWTRLSCLAERPVSVPATASQRRRLAVLACEFLASPGVALMPTAASPSTAAAVNAENDFNMNFPQGYCLRRPCV